MFIRKGFKGQFGNCSDVFLTLDFTVAKNSKDVRSGDKNKTKVCSVLFSPTVPILNTEKVVLMLNTFATRSSV